MEPLERAADPGDEILRRHISVMEAVSGSPLIAGNRVTLLVDGPATYAAMFKAIGDARDHINLEAYIFEDDETGRALADLLLKKQAEGVQVNLIYDSVGCLYTPASFFERLRNGGVEVLEFNPVNPLKARGRWRVIDRDHRKILIVDGKVVVSGGVNISKVYSEGFLRKEEGRGTELPWRDTDVLIEGPAAAEFQKLFLDTWKRQKGPELSARDYFPRLREEGDALMRVIGSTAGEMHRTSFIMYVSAITFAEQSVHLTSYYFLPDRQMVKALADAAARGVDVEVVASATSSVPFVSYAGQYYYSELLKAGVKLYERRNAVVHAKTAVIDGVWSTVGSTNLDFWSFARNDEVNAVIVGSDFAADMERLFESDVQESDPVRLEQWRERPLFPRLIEWFSHLFAPLL
ncbi:MAG: phospholipase D-like domain-containing protein [Nitrospirae bacterium]|nr:phospholipase D-like domain-containing protein [Nitrospirota bacterium]